MPGEGNSYIGGDRKRRRFGGVAKVQARGRIIALCLLAATSVATQGYAAADGRTIAGLSRALAVAEARSGAASPHLLPLLERLAGAQVDGGALAEAAASRRRALKIAACSSSYRERESMVA